MKLVDEPSVGRAYAFGWSTLGATLAGYWWLYVLAALLDAALATWSATSTRFLDGTLVGFIAVFPAMASAMRLLRPDARMHARDVFAILGIYALMVVVCAAAFGVAWLIFRLSAGLGIFTFLIMLVIAIWLSVKVTFTPIFYLNEMPRTLGTAFASSTERISGSHWWSGLGLTLAIAFTLGPPLWILTAVTGSHLPALIDSGGRIALFAIACVIDALAIVNTVWNVTSLTAFASAFGTFGDTPEAMDTSVTPIR